MEPKIKLRIQWKTSKCATSYLRAVDVGLVCVEDTRKSQQKLKLKFEINVGLREASFAGSAHLTHLFVRSLLRPIAVNNVNKKSIFSYSKKRYIQEMNTLKGEKKDRKQRLSESRNLNLHCIRLSFSKKSLDGNSPSGKRHITSLNVAEDEARTNLTESKSAQKAPTFANSPIGYTLRSLLDVNLHDCSQQPTPVNSRLDDSLDVTIYWADERGFKFSLIGGKLATASSLLLLLSDHLGIACEVFKEVCALWMVSDLLEVQLKPHHNPYEIRKNWVQFLQRFTNAESNESVDDEPLLVLKRNVQLSVERELELEDDYTNEILTEILYTSAKQEILNGRYICDINLSVKLAALQMAIEREPSEDLDLFGAAFFRGYIERPLGGPLKEFKKMILSATLPDVPVLVGISCGYVTLVDEAKQEVLLVQRLRDCDCRNIDDHFEVMTSAAILCSCPCFLLIFPERSFLIDDNTSLETEVLEVSDKMKMLQVFSKQAVMMEALVNSLSKLLEKDVNGLILNMKSSNWRGKPMPRSQLLQRAETASKNSSRDRRDAFVFDISVNGYSQSYGLEIIDNQCQSSSSSGTDERAGNGITRRNITDVYSLSSPLINNFDKLCLATLDADGRCLKAQGSLRVLLEVA
uniref:FERM central domain-containing protein n=1 Tax=Setaria digitata TaxID=48799 RepID=A0A915PVE1_9BILA